jgi:Cutinase
LIFVYDTDFFWYEIGTTFSKMRSIKIVVTLLSCITAILAQGNAGGPPSSPKGTAPKGTAGGLGGLPKGMPGCGSQSPSTPSGGEASGRQECSDVHFVIGRGSCEPPGAGSLRRLADAVGKEIPRITLEGIDYPASLNFSNLLGYVSSSSTGATSGKNQITAYAKRCPKTKIVVTGISQVRDDLYAAISAFS